MGLRVLITNWCVNLRTGTEVYVQDLALELRRQGHEPAIHTLVPGPLAEQIRSADIPIFDNLKSPPFRPDVIHGHHYHPTMKALARFSGVPAIFICHDHTSPHDGTPFHPRIRRYFGVSRLCLDRLRAEGAPEARFLANFVDLGRFRPRPPLPERPRRALLFSNYARQETQLPAVTEACRQAGIELDVVGGGVGRTIEHPEDILGDYDVVFAKAKAAMEALAVGAAVVLCDYGGVGPLVTAAEFDRLRPLNFGFQSLTDPLDPARIVRQLARYDAADAARVRDLMRSTSGLADSARRLTDTYREVVAEQAADRRSGDGPRWSPIGNELDILRTRLIWKIHSRDTGPHGVLGRLSLNPRIQHWASKELFGPSWFSRPF
jgi:hypothetical protein